MRSEPALANDAWEALLSAHAAVWRELGDADFWREVSRREYDVLYTLSKHPRPIRLQELNRGVLLSQPALSRLVDRLVRRGMVQRSADPDDARGIALSLTDEGRKRQHEIGRLHAQQVARAVTARLDPDDIRQLTRIGRTLATTPEDAHP